MRWLLTLLNAGDRAAVSQTNFEKIERELYSRLPSLVDGVANTLVGAPTEGDWLLGDLWTDSLGAIFRCTAAGEPGTWVQLCPATVLAGNEPATPPANYLIEIPDMKWSRFYWDAGAAEFKPVFLQP